MLLHLSCMMKNMTWQFNVIIQIYEKEYFCFMCMADYYSPHELILLPWSLVFLWQL